MKTRFIKKLDLKQNGVATEVTVVKAIEHPNDEDGNPQYEIWFIQNDQLDEIDRKRLLEVLRKSAKVGDFQPLYETMADVTLGNGQNALDYFHQYVRIKYPSGVIRRPKHGASAIIKRSSEYA